MKATIFLIVASLLSVRLLAQDTLYTKTGSVLNAKVVEINQDEIKYKKASNPDGPLYTINKSDVVLIHFKNGSKEVFSAGDVSGQDNSNANNPTVVNNNYTSFPPYYRPGVNVVVGGGPFFFNPWRWGGYGYYRPYYHHNYYHHYNGYGHYGHYGRRH
jgi:hypothetical protein